MKRLSGKNRRTGRAPRPIVFKGIFFRLRPCFSFPAAHSSPAAAASERDSIPDGGTDRFLCGPVEGVPGIAGGTTEKHAGKSSPPIAGKAGKRLSPSLSAARKGRHPDSEAQRETFFPAVPRTEKAAGKDSAFPAAAIIRFRKSSVFYLMLAASFKRLKISLKSSAEIPGANSSSTAGRSGTGWPSGMPWMASSGFPSCGWFPFQIRAICS